jgi:hypothetical protein
MYFFAFDWDNANDEAIGNLCKEMGGNMEEMPFLFTLGEGLEEETRIL